VRAHPPSVVNPLPGSVLLLAAALFGVEAVLMAARAGLLGGPAGGEDWRIALIQRFAFSGEVWRWMAETGRWAPEHLVRLVSYAFVHGGFTHMAFVTVFVLALGKLVGETFSNAAVLIVFFVATVVGALAYAVLLNDPRPLFGGFPGAYGLIGSYTFILWVGYGAVNANQLRAFTLIGALLGIQLLFGLFFETGNDWVAEVAGFAAGFALSPVLAPGGVGRALARLRRR